MSLLNTLIASDRRVTCCWSYIHFLPAILASPSEIKISPNAISRFCDCFQSHLQSFSSSNLLFYLGTRKRNHKIFYPRHEEWWSTWVLCRSCWTRMFKRKEFVRSHSRFHKNSKFGEWQSLRCSGKTLLNLEWKLQMKALQKLYPACPVVLLLMKEKEGNQSNT